VGAAVWGGGVDTSTPVSIIVNHDAFSHVTPSGRDIQAYYIGGPHQQNHSFIHMTLLLLLLTTHDWRSMMDCSLPSTFAVNSYQQKYVTLYLPGFGRQADILDCHAYFNDFYPVFVIVNDDQTGRVH